MWPSLLLLPRRFLNRRDQLARKKRLNHRGHAYLRLAVSGFCIARQWQKENARWPGILRSGSKRRAQNGFLSLAIHRLC